MNRRRRSRAQITLLVILLAVGALVAACSGAGSSGSASSGSASSNGPLVIDSAEAAAQIVADESPIFGVIGPKDPSLIGQSSWWETVPLDPSSGETGWRVTFRVGWGDCPSGCINEHSWTYDVLADGSVVFVSEAGPSIPPDVMSELQSAAATTGPTGVTGMVTAGPVCPVERPGQSGCNPRPVDGAVLIVRGSGGQEVTRFVTDASGLFRIALDPGDYTMEPQPVEGLMGTAPATPFTVTQGRETFLDLSYDTGIR
jgi:hypothetical protein